MSAPIRPATPLTDKWWSVAGARTPDWNDGGSEPISQAHLCLARWYGPNATEPVPDDIAPIAPEYFVVDAYLKAAASYLANPELPPLPLALPSAPVPATVIATQETHDSVHQILTAAAQTIPVEHHSFLWALAHLLHLA